MKQVCKRNTIIAMALGAALVFSLSSHAQQKPLFAWDDPNYPKKVATYEKGLAWAVETLPTLPIKEGGACKRGKDPALAFAQGDARTITNVYGCGLGGWHKMPVQFSRGAETNATTKRADLQRMEVWLLDRFPSLFNLGAHDATHAGVACDKQFDGVTGFKYAGGANVGRVLANVLRCESGVWTTFPDLADLP